jgi:7-carboxy-7-deazaguanine synthase
MTTNRAYLKTTYPLMEHFYTLQGEGFHSGKAAYFLRLGGCDVGCVWCDVKESWDASKHPQVSVEEMIKWIVASKAPMVVITGGEPAMYDLTDLTKALQDIQVYVAIETSGAYPLTGELDWICLSPKKFKPALTEVFPLADELKVIVYNKHDFVWAKELEKQVSSECKLYLQPEWDKSDKVLPEIIEFVKQNPQWCVSLQTHKFLNIP